jgi:hypothetical protein
LVCLLHFFLSVSGQTDSTLYDFTNNMVIPYHNYFSLPREHIYTHFNKSCYVPGDDIWFKSYVINPETKLPSLITKNLIVELYYPDGKLLEQKVLYVENGFADNVFNLDFDSPGGNYIFRAYTNWMRNFTDLADITSYLTVVGEQQGSKEADFHVDVQLMPESGTLLEGLVNKVAIKAVDANGMGIKLDGDILNDMGEVVNTFEINDLGIGSFPISVIPGMKLHCRMIHPNGEETMYPLPVAEQQGVIAQVNTFSNNNVYVNIASNDQTILRAQTFYLMIHNNGNGLLLASFQLSPGKTNQPFVFDKSEFLNGVNCLTVFNENVEPVAERLFYISNATIKGNIKIEGEVKYSTVALKIKASDTMENPVVSNLSISVLPGGTSSNNFGNNLMADVLLQSGLRGMVQNPAYYFEEGDSKRIEDLDNLLLTQGWRKYNWKEIMDTIPADITYEFEQGFTIIGEVKAWLGRKSDAKTQVSFFSFETKLFDVMETDSIGRFSFGNLYFPELAHIHLTALNDRGTGWNREISSSVIPEYKADSVIEVPDYYHYHRGENEPSTPQLFSDVILIDGVTVVANKVESPFENSVYRPAMGRTLEVTKENINRYSSVQDLLQKEFNVLARYNSENYKWDVHMGRGILTLQGENPDPVFILNDIITPDLDWLFSLNVNDIEAISVDKTGFGMGVRGANGTILVITRTTPLYEDWEIGNINRLIVKGYASPATYYVPKYAFLPPSPVFTKYATIFWHPNVITDQEGSATLEFESPFNIDSVDVRIEGITDDGVIFLENQRIAIPPK